MADYYSKHLSGSRLQEVYEIASPRIRQYLDAELRHVTDLVKGRDKVLDLGCGYGRVLKEMAPHVGRMVGCDVSRSTLAYARSFLQAVENYDLVRMTADRTGFRENSFDGVVCVQNGISAFGVNPTSLVAEAVRVSREGGLIVFSGYSPRIWEVRLEWFRAQSRAGLVGQIDERLSRGGTIVCKDGFRSTTVTGPDFSTLFRKAGQRARILEIDESSIFAEVVKGS